MTIFLKLFIWFIPILANIIADRKGRKPNYLMMLVLRAMAAILHGALFITESNSYWWQWWPVILYQITSFWIFFELGLNFIRHNPPLYYDHKEGDSGWLDELFKWAGPVLHLIAKIVCLVLLIFSIWKIYQIN